MWTWGHSGTTVAGVLALGLTAGLTAVPASADDANLLAAPGLEVAEYSALGAGAGSITVNWDDAEHATPGAPAVTGYTVRACSQDGVDEVGKRLPNTAATKETTTLTGLVAGDIYSIEIAAKSEAGEGTAIGHLAREGGDPRRARRRRPRPCASPAPTGSTCRSSRVPTATSASTSTRSPV